MKKLHSISFNQNVLKYIIVELKNNCWQLLNHGEISLPDNKRSDIQLQLTNEERIIFRKKRLKKNKGCVTIEAHHTYLNRKSINTLEKLNHLDIIRFNYENILPILFEKNRYGLDYNVEYIKDRKTTEISFISVLQDTIDSIYQSCLNINVDPITLSPSYQYFSNTLKKEDVSIEKKEFVLYVESSNDFLTLVLIHNQSPIMKRSIDIDEQLETETNNFFYFLKHYVMVPEVLILFSFIDKNIKLLINQTIKPYYDPTCRNIQELLKELPCFEEIEDEFIVEYQECFIALGGMDFDEPIK